MKPDSDEQQATVVDAENNGDHNSSNEAGRDNSKLLDQLRTCSLEFIRSDPGLSYIYDMGFKAGLYEQNQRQLEALVSSESATGVMSADMLEAVEDDSWATVVALNIAMKSDLEEALKAAEDIAAMISDIKQGIYVPKERP